MLDEDENMEIFDKDVDNDEDELILSEEGSSEDDIESEWYRELSRVERGTNRRATSVKGRNYKGVFVRTSSKNPKTNSRVRDKRASCYYCNRTYIELSKHLTKVMVIFKHNVYDPISH